MKASFSTIGSVPRSAAMAGSEVAMTVPSMFSMNSAEAIIKGMSRAEDGILAMLAWVSAEIQLNCPQKLMH